MGKVHHWKHGWIPLDSFARGVRDGKISAPNGDHGIPVRKMPDRSAEAKQYAADIKELAPETNPRPHYQFASQSMGASYDGGVVIDGHEIDALIDRLQRQHEGTSDRLDVNRAGGAPFRITRAQKGKPEEIAQRRARRLKQELGLEFAPLPEYQPAVEGSSVKGGYTGGLVLGPPTAKDVIDKLDRLHTGTATRLEAKRAAGLRRY